MRELLIALLITLSLQQIEIDLITSQAYTDSFTNIKKRDMFRNTKKVYDTFLMNVNIGNSNQAFHLLVDTTSYPLWIQSKDTVSKVTNQQITFDLSLGPTVKSEEINFKYNKDTCEGNLITEKVALGKEESVSMTFPLIDDFSSYLWRMDGILGFSRFSAEKDKFPEESSLMFTMNKLQKIENNVFSIHFFDNTTPQMYIGKVHDDFSKTDQVISCNTLSNTKGYWSCNMKEIYHDNKVIPINNEVVFDTSVDKIFFPEVYKDKLSSLFPKCLIREAEKGHYYYECHKRKLLLPFALSFGDKVIKIPNEMILNKLPNRDVYLVRIIFTNKFPEIRFGTHLLKYFHILFNGADNQIQLYARNTELIGLLSDYTTKTSAFSYVFILCLIIGFVVTIVIAWKIILTQSQLKSNKKHWMIEKFNQDSYSQMKTINSSITI